MGYRIGIIAGKGRITEIVINEAKKRGFFTVVAGIRNYTDSKLEAISDEFIWFEPEEFLNLIDFLKKNKIRDLILTGKINYSLIDRLQNKNRIVLSLINELSDKKPYSLFLLLKNYLMKFNFKIKNIKLLLKDYFPEERVFTNDMPSKKILEDIKFGWRIAKRIASLDIGQTVVVKEKAVIAVEGMEGTDETIIRAGKLAGKGIVVVKVGRPYQDMRFDVPVVGFSTVEKIASVKGKCLCIEAEKTIFLDQDKVISYANNNDICVIALKQKSILLGEKV
ncbi:UDP-2,3-diacylglucosamine diphosphatase LpxI [Candidatus Aminicenantes bacterium AC-708-M15]|jgi:hypothetical protein|nr:UDP-2,3-diacylglucosamine diphosphatase LpxI [SCandidatus Aminicenantes bacterium Aminicenantia_JdfR_composite]MCP2597959.1 UDP-2,3-diacylglucosamine diphosphatase LpxI [Candidatus Aminicenantes bacterium AC-335-L06]MCP2604239.1 UDP-2,3-diacylglucosamine diphosphatase LpxI [Candidatus Aminicenantes bacterium AC-708-M15]MCP2606443.1 UDP-2,3-diacylglucosamine diphosphatase LpxI [Candidatus Aminicenantes bacterium AC-708-I09]MCP2618166.1 UDP-2,3-diacylglucosamine diphosphatase LpxI [Candidatus 